MGNYTVILLPSAPFLTIDVCSVFFKSSGSARALMLGRPLVKSTDTPLVYYKVLPIHYHGLLLDGIHNKFY